MHYRHKQTIDNLLSTLSITKDTLLKSHYILQKNNKSLSDMSNKMINYYETYSDIKLKTITDKEFLQIVDNFIQFKTTTAVTLDRFKVYLLGDIEYRRYVKSKTDAMSELTGVEKSMSIDNCIRRHGTKKGTEIYNKWKADVNTVSLDYFIKKVNGDVENAKKLQSERQRTFTLDKCIEKYGNEKGTKVFNERQERWKKTLDSKTDEEKQDINRRKGISKGGTPHHGSISFSNIDTHPLRDKPCTLYYVKFYNEDIEFYKVGITTQTIDNRFSGIKSLNYDILDMYNATTKECFIFEQNVFMKYSDIRETIEYKEFKSTECFSKEINFSDVIISYKETYEN